MNHSPGDVFGFAHPEHILEHRRPAAARRVAVDVQDAVLVDVRREGVGKPGGPGVAAVGVAGPPGEPHAAAEVLPVRPQYACAVQQRGVPRGLVAEARLTWLPAT